MKGCPISSVQLFLLNLIQPFMNHKEHLVLDKFLSNDMTEATVFPTTLSMQDVIDMAPVKLEVPRGNQDINTLVSFFQEGLVLSTSFLK